MTTFDTLLKRHGEPWVQDIVEQIERYEGISLSVGTSLEERWNVLMQDMPSKQGKAA